jgi:hypothetical protein
MRAQAVASSSGPVTAWPVSSSECAIRLQSRRAILWMDVEAMPVEYGVGASLASPLERRSNAVATFVPGL